MQIVFRHVHIRVPCQALNGFQWYALSLKLGDIGVTAAMRRKQPNLPCSDQRFLEMLAEYTRIADRNFLAIPDILFGGISELLGNFPEMGRNTAKVSFNVSWE